MIISNSRNYIFFHVPKCGGTSITHLLDLGLAWNDVMIGGTKTGELFNGDWARRFKLFKHTTPPTARRILGEEIFNNYFKFIYVRDPISRFKSATHFLHQVVSEKRQWVLRAYPQQYLDEVLSLRSVGDALDSSFFLSICEKPPAACNEIEMWFKPQSLFYDLLQNSHADSSAFFKLEALNDSLDVLLSRGITTQEDIENSLVLQRRLNQSTKILDDQLSDSQTARLREVYAADYLSFGY